MKKILLMLAVAVMGTGLTTFATTTTHTYQQGQGPQGTPEERAERQTKMMTEQLALTADQSTKVKAIFLERAKEMQALREKNQGDREAMMQSMRPLMQKYNDQVKAVLTAEQFAKYQENMAQRGGGQGNGGGRRNGAAQGNNK